MNITENHEPLLEFSSAKHLLLNLQSEVAESGLICLAMIAGFYGKQLNMPTMRKRFSTSLTGINLQQLIDLANGFGLSSRALQCPPSELQRLALPCILHWDMKHLVVLTQVTDKSVTISDPVTGKQTFPLTELNQHFTGIVLELTPANEFSTKKEQKRNTLTPLWNKMTGLKNSLIRFCTLSFTLQLFTLAAPYCLQWLVSKILNNKDASQSVVEA